MQWNFWNKRPFQKRRDVKCQYCWTVFRVYGNRDAGNRGPAGYRYDRERIVWCPVCNDLKRCKDIKERI